ncbi:MAG: hypothetical protein JXB88_08640 [Spirochaetales bacterium]|nr:hypothetical protein [Spirochaetales bacterium]
MSDRIQWLEHKGKRILYVDYSGLFAGPEYLELIGEMEKEILKYMNKPGSIYTITNVAGSHVNDEVKKRFDAMVRNTMGISKARAIVGIMGIQKLIARAIKKDVYFAGSIEEAKDWLVTR